MRFFRRRSWLLAMLLAAGCSRRPASIEISPKHVKIYGLGRTQRLAARILDKKGQPLETSVPSWSSSQTSVVEVDSSGRLTGKSEGKATVKASLEKLEASVPVEVVDVQALEISPPAARLIGPAGAQFPLTAIVKNSKDQRLGVKPTWTSSDPKIATVSADGVVTSISRGTTSVVARVGDLQTLSEIAVEIRPISKIEIRPATALVRVGDSQHFEVVAYGSDGRPIEGVSAVYSSSNPAVASLDGTGKASGLAPGTALIQATLAGVSAQATLIVN